VNSQARLYGIVNFGRSHGIHNFFLPTITVSESDIKKIYFDNIPRGIHCGTSDFEMAGLTPSTNQLAELKIV